MRRRQRATVLTLGSALQEHKAFARFHLADVASTSVARRSSRRCNAGDGRAAGSLLALRVTVSAPDLAWTANSVATQTLTVDIEPCAAGTEVRLLL